MIYEIKVQFEFDFQIEEREYAELQKSLEKATEDFLKQQMIYQSMQAVLDEKENQTH